MLWGFAFVAQRSGMEFVGPFTFNALRFTLGGISLIPLLLINRKRKFNNEPILPLSSKKILLRGGIIAGVILFLGASFQQGGIVYTTAGKAGFITGFYIILVPILGIMFKQKTSAAIWLGAVIALAGLYLLSVQENFSIGLAFTLQVIAQRDAHPSHAAIIMSLEAVFALIGGWIVLDEIIPLRGLIGCGLMLTGMIIPQIEIIFKRRKSHKL